MAKFFNSLSKEELENVMEVEAPQVDETGDAGELSSGIAEDSNKIEAMNDATDAGEEEIKNLEEKDQALAEIEEKEEAGEPVTESYKIATIAVAHEALRSASRRLGMSVEELSINHESSDSKSEIKLAREGIGDALKKAKDAVVSAAQKVWDWIVGLCKKILGWFGVKFKDTKEKEKNIKEKTNELKEKVKESQENADNPDTKKAMNAVNGVLNGVETGNFNISPAELAEEEEQAYSDANDAERVDNESKGILKDVLSAKPEEIKEKVLETNPDATADEIKTIQDAINKNVWVSTTWMGGIRSVNRIAKFINKSQCGRNIDEIMKAVVVKANNFVKDLSDYGTKLKSSTSNLEENIGEVIKVNNNILRRGLGLDNYVDSEELQRFTSTTEKCAMVRQNSSITIMNIADSTMDDDRGKVYEVDTKKVNEAAAAILSIPLMPVGYTYPEAEISKTLNSLVSAAEKIKNDLRSVTNTASDVNRPAYDEYKNGGHKTSKRNSLIIISATARSLSNVAQSMLNTTQATIDLYNTQLKAKEKLLSLAEKMIDTANKKAA